ncbi:MAG: FapA family protein [Acidobacteriota bacterium]
MTQDEFLAKLSKEGEDYVLDGNLGGATERLFCPASLIVRGDIESGTSIVVEGDVTVRGSVFDASVTATRSVTVEESFVGSGKGKITSGIDVTVKVINAQSVVAKGNITIGAESLNADLHAYDAIEASGARIVGGKSEASNAITVRNLGSEDGRQTKVYLGNRKKLLQRMNEIGNEKKSLNERLPKINRCIYKWNRVRIDGVVLTDEQEKMLEKLRTMRDSFPRQMELFRKESDHLKMLLREKVDSVLTIRESIYENVLVDINGYREVTDSEQKSIRYYMGDHRLFVQALH